MNGEILRCQSDCLIEVLQSLVNRLILEPAVHFAAADVVAFDPHDGVVFAAKNYVGEAFVRFRLLYQFG